VSELGLIGPSAEEAEVNMYYVYVLKSKKNGKLYTGFTNNLTRRLLEHNTISTDKASWTSRNRPFELLFYEAFKNKADAQKDEHFFKSGYGREVLREKIKNSLL